MSRFHLPTFAAAIFLGASLSAAPAAAGVISFVSSKGVNAGDCSSPASPCLTLGFALNQTVSGGEIKIIDAGNYVAVTIDKSITITGVDGASINRGSAGAAMTITAGATDVVTIRNLIFDGIRQGATNGVLVKTAGVVTIKNCQFQNFALAGVHLVFVGNTSQRFAIEDTIFSENFEGIKIEGNLTPRGALKRVASVNNRGNGIVVLNGEVTIADSIFSGNVDAGIKTVGQGARVLVNRSTVTNNSKGADNSAGGTIQSTGDNAISFNTSLDVSGTLTNIGTK